MPSKQEIIILRARYQSEELKKRVLTLKTVELFNFIIFRTIKIARIF
jgi:hypothetical protein